MCHLKVGYFAVGLILLSVFHREQRQKEATKTAVVNSFPKDRDYRREAMQASAASSFTAASKYYKTYYPHQPTATGHNESHVYMFCCLAGPKYQVLSILVTHLSANLPDGL